MIRYLNGQDTRSVPIDANLASSLKLSGFSILYFYRVCWHKPSRLKRPLSTFEKRTFLLLPDGVVLEKFLLFSTVQAQLLIAGGYFFIVDPLPWHSEPTGLALELIGRLEPFLLTRTWKRDHVTLSIVPKVPDKCLECLQSKSFFVKR